jgi:hypothetical protein
MPQRCLAQRTLSVSERPLNRRPELFASLKLTATRVTCITSGGDGDHRRPFRFVSKLLRTELVAKNERSTAIRDYIE